MKEILFFSNNKNKIIEISNFFKNSSIKILSLNDFEKIYSPKENGSTFEENAKIKSLYGYKNFKIICFADDSGICINALKGKPGINSKNFLHSTKNERDILKKIISIAKLKNNYDAEFHSKICLTIANPKPVPPYTMRGLKDCFPGFSATASAAVFANWLFDPSINDSKIYSLFNMGIRGDFFVGVRSCLSPTLIS